MNPLAPNNILVYTYMITLFGVFQKPNKPTDGITRPFTFHIQRRLHQFHVSEGKKASASPKKESITVHDL